MKTLLCSKCKKRDIDEGDVNQETRAHLDCGGIVKEVCDVCLDTYEVTQGEHDDLIDVPCPECCAESDEDDMDDDS